MLFEKQMTVGPTMYIIRLFFYGLAEHGLRSNLLLLLPSGGVLYLSNIWSFISFKALKKTIN